MGGETERALEPLRARSSDWLPSGKEYLCYGVKSTLQACRQGVEIEAEYIGLAGGGALFYSSLKLKKGTLRN